MEDFNIKIRLDLNKYETAKSWMEEKKALVKEVYKIEDIDKLVILQNVMDDWYMEGLKKQTFKKEELDKIFANKCKELNIDTNIEIEREI